MNTITRTHTLDDGRITREGEEPLLVRIEIEDHNTAKVSLGIKRKDGSIGWQLAIGTSAVFWIEDKVKRAWAAWSEENPREENPVEPTEGGG